MPRPGACRRVGRSSAWECTPVLACRLRGASLRGSHRRGLGGALLVSAVSGYTVTAEFPPLLALSPATTAGLSFSFQRQHRVDDPAEIGQGASARNKTPGNLSLELSISVAVAE